MSEIVPAYLIILFTMSKSLILYSSLYINTHTCSDYIYCPIREISSLHLFSMLSLRAFPMSVFALITLDIIVMFSYALG